MWQIKVRGIEAHGDCPLVIFPTGLWLIDVNAKVVKLGADRRDGLQYQTEAEVVEVMHRPVMRLFLVKAVHQTDADES